MPFILFFIVYQVIQIISLPIIAIYLLWRRIKGKNDFIHFKHRMGIIPQATSQTIWIHSVSVGETLAAEYFIQNLWKKEKSVYLTSGTPNAGQVSKNFKYTYHAYLPYDFLPSMALAFKRIRPKAIIILEGDWWPNLVMLAKILHIPIYGLNARVTKHSQLGSLLFKIISKNIINLTTHLFVQTAEDKTEFKKNGINGANIEVLGNIKTFNVQAKLQTLALAKKTTLSPVIMAGSTHPGEIKIIFNSIEKLKKDFPRTKYIIVPRHLHWLNELCALAQEKGKVFVLKSKPNEDFSTILEEYDFVIGGAIGIMFELYAYASIFYLGGTFVPVGGHNLLEPAVWGIPSIVGPHHQNCLDTLKSLQALKAGFIAHNDQDLYTISTKLLTDTKKLEALRSCTEGWIKNEALMCEHALEKFSNML